MKKTVLILICLLPTLTVTSQITITSADMPNAGDSILVSVTNSIGSLDQTLTGANYNWDYSTLAYTSQRYDKFDSPFTFPTVFAVLFSVLNTSYGRENRAITAVSITGLSITDAYDFLKESTSALKQVGGGLTINGTPIPFYYTPNDYIYRFPLDYLNNDSSDYAYNLTIPTIGYYGETGHRVNLADGWGSLITPYMTYPSVLRVKSVVTSQDTLNYTTLGFGITIPRPTRIEYKWLANGKQIPVLEIDVNIVGGNEVITNVQYQDSLHTTAGVAEILNADSHLIIYPNPISNSFVMNYSLTAETPVKITVTDVVGKTIATLVDEKQNSGTYLKPINTGDLHLSDGVYFVNIQTNKFSEVKKLVVEK